MAIVRLNYAHDLRYGVLTDLASRLVRGSAVDVTMGYVNVIWQGDANALALAALAPAAAPEPYVVNVAGREILSVRDLAQRLGNVQLTPTSVLVDKHGQIVKRFVGEPDFVALHKLVDQLLAES